MSKPSIKFSLDALNTADYKCAVAMILPLIERSPNIAARIAELRPFASSLELVDAFSRCVQGQDEEATLNFLRAHPMLAEPNPHSMTKESQAEQGRMQLIEPSHLIQTTLSDLNNAYVEKFGFPFIIALHRYSSMTAVISEFERRIKASRNDEIKTALIEILSVSNARLAKALEPNKNRQVKAGGLSIHAYDIANGKPAVNLAVKVVRCVEGKELLVANGIISETGTFDHPCNAGQDVIVGKYIAYFDVGSFFDQLKPIAIDNSFLEVVTYQFNIADSSQHYHLPFKFTPWGFSLFRGGE